MSKRVIRKAATKLPTPAPQVQEKKPRKPRPDVPAVCYTIREFCVAHKISEAHYYGMKAAGIGPKEADAAGKFLITFESANEWLARCLRGEVPKVPPKRKTAPVMEPAE